MTKSKKLTLSLKRAAYRSQFTLVEPRRTGAYLPSASEQFDSWLLIGRRRYPSDFVSKECACIG